MARMRRALDELRIGGVATNAAFQRSLLESREFVEGSYDTGFVERWLANGVGDSDADLAVSA
jgi:acetyl-CoA carboxylase biotin carboxylase subunit